MVRPNYPIDKYQREAARTINPDNTENETVLHALFGIASEAGEILGLYQKELQGHELNPERVKSELGDLLWFIGELATAYGWKLSDVATGNIEKLMKRFPEGFSAEKSIHRQKGDL